MLVIRCQGPMQRLVLNMYMVECLDAATRLFYSPGMPEMLSPSAALVGGGLGETVALVTDGRFSGATHGMFFTEMEIFKTQ